MSNSIQFTADGFIYSNDGVTISKAINTPGEVVPDSQRHTVGVQVNTSDFPSFRQHDGGHASQGSSTVRTQLRNDNGLVNVAGFETTPEVAATLQKQAPELFIDPTERATAEAKASDEARAQEVSREELNRHPGEIEGYHQHLVGEVSTQNLIGLMVYGQKGEAPPDTLLNKIAEEMSVPLDEAVSKINAVSAGTSAQFTVLARSMGLDADKAADWIKTHRRDTGMVAAQAHFLRRDLMAWKPLLNDYQAATGDGRAKR